VAQLNTDRVLRQGRWTAPSIRHAARSVHRNKAAALGALQQMALHGSYPACTNTDHHPRACALAGSSQPHMQERADGLLACCDRHASSSNIQIRGRPYQIGGRPCQIGGRPCQIGRPRRTPVTQDDGCLETSWAVLAGGHPRPPLPEVNGGHRDAAYAQINQIAEGSGGRNRWVENGLKKRGAPHRRRPPEASSGGGRVNGAAD
jgi:hypothetical protein